MSGDIARTEMQLFSPILQTVINTSCPVLYAVIFVTYWNISENRALIILQLVCTSLKYGHYVNIKAPFSFNLAQCKSNSV